MTVERTRPAKSPFEQLVEALVVDKHELDEEWIRQPDLFWRAASGLAKAIADRDDAKQTLASVRAKLAGDLREMHTKASEKFTVDSIGQEVELEDEVVTARKDFNNAEIMVGRWAALKESFSQRGYTLKGVTELHISNYYQTNSGGSRQAKDQAADENRRRSGEERQQRQRT